MTTHITKVCASSLYYIYNIHLIRKYLSRKSTATLVYAFITSRLDHCNGRLYGLPDCLLNKLQRVQNACTRLIFREQKFYHTTPLIYEIHITLKILKSQCRNISRISNQFRKIEFWFIPPKQPFGMVISENDIKKSPSALHLDNFRKVRKFTKKYNFYS